MVMVDAWALGSCTQVNNGHNLLGPCSASHEASPKDRVLEHTLSAKMQPMPSLETRVVEGYRKNAAEDERNFESIP